MSLLRGILMLAAGVFVIWRGWVGHAHTNAWPFYAIGALAIALGLFRLFRKPPKPLV